MADEENFTKGRRGETRQHVMGLRWLTEENSSFEIIGVLSVLQGVSFRGWILPIIRPLSRLASQKSGNISGANESAKVLFDVLIGSCKRTETGLGFSWQPPGPRIRLAETMRLLTLLRDVC